MTGATPTPTPTVWPRIPAPGWQGLYRQLQADVAALDPYATVRAKSKTGHLDVTVVSAAPAVLQRIRELCYAAEDTSQRTCEVCGNPGQRVRDGRGWIRSLCPDHAAMPLVELRALLRESGS